MANLKRKLANFKIFAAVFLSAASAPAMCAQALQQLQVEVGPNQQIGILARDVSYGEVLRALQGKSGWEIEIPPLADELKLSYVHVETTQPSIALAKLLEGSGLGYACLGGVNGSRTVKVVVIPSAPREASVIHDAGSSVPDNAVAQVSPPPPVQEQAVTTSQPNAAAAEATPDLLLAPSTVPLANAVNAIGVPPGVSPADVGRAMTFPISDAAKIMGVPPGVSPGDVGKTITLPLPTGPGKHP
jgi:hypothetical protein